MSTACRFHKNFVFLFMGLALLGVTANEASAAAPAITVQPVSAVATIGQATSLSVSNSGTAPFGYQWIKDGVILQDQTNSTLSFSAFKFTDSGSYSVVITNTDGMALSFPANLSTPNAPLRVWGYNNAGQLGDGTTTDTNQSIQVASNVVAMAGGNSHSLFVKADGTLWAMGTNAVGQLGNGTCNSTSLPIQVAGNVIAAAAGYAHSLIVKADGTLWAMGDNSCGQLGSGTTNNSLTPIAVASNVVAAAAGSYQSLFVKADGTLWAMGDNSYGQMGNGTTANTNVPVQVASNVVAMAGGNSHSLFVKADGTLWAMGDNTYGQLGNGTTNNSLTPIAVASNVVAAAGGGAHSLFMKADGTLWAMGYNGDGQLGNGTTTNASLPVQVASNVVSSAGGGGHSLFMKADGTLWAMGYNSYGQLGNGTTIGSLTPIQVTGLMVAGLAKEPIALHSLAIAVPVMTDQTITFPTISDKITTDTVGLSATVSSGLPVSFSVLSGSASISGGTNLSFTGAGIVSIVASQAGDGSYNAAPNVTNLFHVYALSASSGAYAGGNSITITNGNIGSITNVLVGGVIAAIQDSGVNWVRITVPAVGSSGAKDIVVQTSDNGDRTLAKAYTVNPAGQIRKITYGPGTWTTLDKGMNNSIQALAVVGTNLYAGGAFTSAGRVAANDIAKGSLVQSSYGSTDLATSFQESTLHTNLHLDIPNASVGTITLDTVNHNLLFPGPGQDLWLGRNGLPFAWAAIPQLGSGGVWRAETEVKYNVSSHAQGRIAGLTTYSGPDGTGGANAGQEFTFGLDQWDSPYGAWVQGLGDNHPGDSGNLNSSLVTDILDLRMDVTVGAANYNTYRFYFKLPSNETWSSLGTIHYTSTDDRVALFFKGYTTNVSFNYFNVTTLVYKACSNWIWASLGSGMNASITALAQDGTNLYAGGSFTNAGGVAANYIARWDGSGWINLGSGMNGSVSALAYDGTNLYAGGSFTTAGGVAANYIARWDGSGWTSLGGGMNGSVSALAIDGANLFAGGSFTTAGGVAANYIARWDGSGWINLGSGMNGSVSALAHDGANLYAGGSFTTAGGVSANRMAQWNGTTWTNLGPYGMNSTVSALAHGGGNIFAGGSFTTAGGYSANRVAKWIPSPVETSGVEPGSGSVTGGYQVVISGQDLGNGSDVTDVKLCGVSVASITSQSSTQIVVVAGAGTIGTGDVRVYSGSFGETVRSNAFTYTTAGIAVSGPSFPPVFRGRAITNVFTVTNSGNATLMITGVTNNGAGASYFDVSALNGLVVAAGTASNFPVVFAPLAVGTFTPTSYTLNNSLTANYSFALSGTCFDLSADTGPYAGGNTITITNGADFGTVTNVLAGGVNADITGSGANWVTITMPAAGSTGTVDLVIQTSDHGDTTFAGIYTYNPAGQVGSDSMDVWMNLDAGMNNYVYTLKSDANGTLYAGGEFSMADGVSVNYIAKWDPVAAAWANLGAGLDGSVMALATDPNGNLYVSGNFYTAGGVPAYYVAKWNPVTEEWSALGDGLDNAPVALVCDASGNLYAGGYFTVAGGVSANYVAKWNPETASWSALGDGLDNAPVALVCDASGNLYAGGWFNWAGGVFANYVAKWNPETASWSALGDGLDNGVNALAMDTSGNLYAGGWFNWVGGGVFASYVAKWNPETASWSALGDGLDNGVNALAMDTNGNLYAGGYFTTAGGVPANYAAEWNGTTWTNMAGGMNNVVAALGLNASGDVYAGGYFDMADGRTVNYVAEWSHIPASAGVSPVSGSCTGGYPVVITGMNLGNGSDITDVKLCGVSAASITSQSSTQIVVVAGTGTAGTGDVQVNSTSCGETVKSNAFTYLKGDQTITVPAISDKLTTDTVGLSATASSGLPVSFSVFSGPASISGGTNLSFTGTGIVSIVASQAGDASWNAAPDVTNRFTVQHGVPVAGTVTLQRATNQILKVTTTMLLEHSTDPEGSALSVVWVSPGSTNGGAVTLAGRWVTYTPPEGNSTDDFFQFRVRNAFGGEAAGTAKIETLAQTGSGSQTLNFNAAPVGGNVELRIFGIPGRAYIVQGATRLIEPNWTNLSGCVIGAGGYVDFTETNPPSPRYYRTVKP